ncbi:MAG: radical SAM protein [Deltaproteobacteria bacterium]|nr:radical SAM protein [Deltaproteobacteria bacterium]
MSKREVLDAIAAGVPTSGPRTVHVDVTNACNAACITCWDHSPLLTEPRPPAWKKRRIELATFARLVEDLAAMGSVRAVILSGMGDPLVHPDIYEMIALVKARGWHLTVMTNLIAADIARLVANVPDQVLVGVHGATPRAYSAFHPGWDEREFNVLCAHLRALAKTPARVRHVQVINRDTAPELVDMIGFGARFRADRVNFKLASLYGGTESCRIDDVQRRWLADDAIPRARARSAELGVATNLDLFAQQLAAGVEDDNAIVPIAEVGCFQGYVYTRITASLDVLYCCNTEVRVGSLDDGPVSQLWRGPAWEALRAQLRRGEYPLGCERCGKFEQNVEWSRRVREELGEAVWREVTGADRARVPARLPVIA